MKRIAIALTLCLSMARIEPADASLECEGVWDTGVWHTTVFDDGVWDEDACGGDGPGKRRGFGVTLPGVGL